MKYLKSFEKYTAMVGTGARPELSGQLIKDDEDIITPINMEITGHIGTPVKNVRVQKIGKSPKAKQRKAAPNYPNMQDRNWDERSTELNALPSQS